MNRGLLKHWADHPRHALLDGVVLLALLAGANLLFSPADLGWQRPMVSPYLVVPVMIGARYGSLPGMVAGLVTMLLSLIPEGRGSELGWAGLWAEHADGMLGFVGVGALCGELKRVARVREEELTAANHELRARVRRVDDDILVLRETKLELERLLVTYDAELSTLDADLRRLFDADREEIYRRLLLLLQQQVRVTEAAIYRQAASGDLERVGLLGAGEGLPERLRDGDVEMVDLALKRRTLVSVPEFWDRPGGGDRRHLLAMPLLDSQDEPLGAVLISRMPFMSLNRKSLRLLALSCRWAARIVEIRDPSEGTFRISGGPTGQRVYFADAFRHHVELADSTHRVHQLPSNIAVFRLPGESASRQGLLEQLVLKQVRAGDFAGELGLPDPHVAVLLTLTGERGAAIFVERVGDACQQDPQLARRPAVRMIEVTTELTFDQLWQQLTTHATQDYRSA
jgi:hypothetical protein